MNSNTNNNLNTEAKSFIADVHEYSDFEERALNKKLCIADEHVEQERRQADLEGELIRRSNAKLASGFITDARLTSLKATAFASVVKEAMMQAGSNISAVATNAKTSTTDLGSKGWSTVRAKVSEASVNVQDVGLSAPVINARIAALNTAIHATNLASDISRKGAEIGHEIYVKGADTLHQGEEKYFQATKLISDKSMVVAHSLHRLVKFGDFAYDLVSDVVKRITKRFSGWIQTTWSQAVHSANLSYAVHLTEKERTRRCTSEDESAAILNALAVSSLVKELAPELYRPTEEPSRAYSFALLEEKEQQYRIAHEKLGENLSGKAQYVANMIKARQADGSQEQSSDVKELLPVFTAEQVILPDPLQIFEEPRNLKEEFSFSTPVQKLQAQEPVASSSPQAVRASM